MRFLIAAVVTAILMTSVQAQVQNVYTMTFEEGSSDLVIDSIYPNGLWQMGTPDKAVFDSVYTAPNALVTDTILPYPAGLTGYAEFHILVHFFGEGIFLQFLHRLDIDEGEAAGWVEYWDPVFTNGWVRIGPGQPWASSGIGLGGMVGTVTDTGVVFNQPFLDWEHSELSLECLGVFFDLEARGGGADTMRFRFAFTSTANTTGRDGWMIDDVQTYNMGCSGSIEDAATTRIGISPVPADEHVRLDVLQGGQDILSLDVLGTDGSLIRREPWLGLSTQTIHTSDLANGAYGLIVRGRTHDSVGRFVVVH